MYFFDLDGTLLDSTGVWMDIDVDFLGRRGISPVPADYTYYVTHHSAPEAARYTKERYALPETEEEIIRIWGEMAYEAYAKRVPLKAGAGEFLERCAAQGIPMALVTSCLPELCRAALEHHGLGGVFQGVFITTELGLEKGDGTIFRYAARQLGTAPERCTVFDDSPGYCAAAKEAGFRVVGLYDIQFHDQQEELKQICTPERHFESFLGLSPEMLEGKNS